MPSLAAVGPGMGSASSWVTLKAALSLGMVGVKLMWLAQGDVSYHKDLVVVILFLTPRSPLCLNHYVLLQVGGLAADT